MTYKKIMKIIFFVLLFFASLAVVFQSKLGFGLAQQMANRRMSFDQMSHLPDGLHVGLCGAGSPLPDDRRMGACTLVVAGKRLFVFDTGNGASRNIGKMGFVQGQIEAIFLTHFHSDHIDGLGELLMQRWVSGGNKSPVSIFGPPGVVQVVKGFTTAYAQDAIYRVAHHGESTLPKSGFGGLPKTFTPPENGHVVLINDDDLKIVAFNVDHAPVHPAVGYAIEYKGRKVVISGDTRKSFSVIHEARDSDVLIHEAMNRDMVKLLENAAQTANRPNVKKLMADIVDYHASPDEAAEVAKLAKVKFLLLNHIAPPLPSFLLEKSFLGNASKIYDGTIKIGIDGDFISLPSHQKKIEVSHRFQ